MRSGAIRAIALSVSATVAALVLAGCTSSGSAGTTSAAGGGEGSYGYKFAVVTHGVAGDSFWDVVKNGAEQAGKDYGVDVSYQGDSDPQKQAQLIDAAVNQKVDGVVVSMANPEAMTAPIKHAMDAGIPVITINSGAEQSEALGVLGHVGQDESIAGQAAGKRLKDAGITKLLCVIQEAGNVALEARCDGAEQGFGGSVERLQVNNTDLPAAQATLKAKLQEDPSIDGVLMLGSNVGAIAAQAISESGSKAQLATFDLNPDILQQVKDGKILFAVDQQQYLQGYLPVVMLTLYKANLNTVGGGQPVLTGPGFVTKDNADQIIQLSKQGTR